MDDCSVMMSEHLAVEGVSVGRATSSSTMAGNGNWDGAAGMDQITVVRIDDTHIEDQSPVGEKFKDGGTQFYELEEYSMPSQEEEEEEEEDSVFVIEYSNPEEEGESYQFTMSVDRSVPVTKPVTQAPAVRGKAGAPLPVTTTLPRPRHEARLKRKPLRAEEEDEVLSNKSILGLGENFSNVEINAAKPLICSLCPPPGRLFKRGAGLAVHLKQVHFLKERKKLFCKSCQQSVRTQRQLDTHTKRHANQDAVFTCLLCLAENKTGFRGTRLGLKAHLEERHSGVVPRCDICHKGFKSLKSYLADQFRHVGKSPYYCPKCQIYEMTERGLVVHVRNHDKKKKEAESEPHLLTAGVSANIDNSATDDSDF